MTDSKVTYEVWSFPPSLYLCTFVANCNPTKLPKWQCSFQFWRKHITLVWTGMDVWLHEHDQACCVYRTLYRLILKSKYFWWVAWSHIIINWKSSGMWRHTGFWAVMLGISPYLQHSTNYSLGNHKKWWVAAKQLKLNLLHLLFAMVA